MTDWGLFFEDCGNDFNLLTDVITSYILFCEDVVTPTKQITIHPNNKQWVTKDMKICLVLKKKAFLEGDTLRVRELQKEFRRKAKMAKIHYKDKVEQKLNSGNVRMAWQGLNTMIGRTPKPAMINCHDPASFAEQLNNFFSRFDNCSTSANWNPHSPSLSNQALIIDEKLVASVLS